jgi:hypothetical protein
MGSKQFGDRYNRRGNWRLDVASLDEVASMLRLKGDIRDFDDCVHPNWEQYQCPGMPPATFCIQASAPHTEHLVRVPMYDCRNCGERYSGVIRISDRVGFCSQWCQDKYDEKAETDCNDHD